MGRRACSLFASLRLPSPRFAPLDDPSRIVDRMREHFDVIEDRIGSERMYEAPSLRGDLAPPFGISNTKR